MTLSLQSGSKFSSHPISCKTGSQDKMLSAIRQNLTDPWDLTKSDVFKKRKITLKSPQQCCKLLQFSSTRRSRCFSTVYWKFPERRRKPPPFWHFSSCQKGKGIAALTTGTEVAQFRSSFRATGGTSRRSQIMHSRLCRPVESIIIQLLYTTPSFIWM